MHPSHFKSRRSIYEFLCDEGKSGIQGVDTRMLTIKTREHGTMRAALIVGRDDGPEAVRLAREQPDISKLDLISQVTCGKPYKVEGYGPKMGLHFVLMDFGVKRNIIRSLASRGIDITVVPAGTRTKEIVDLEPDALFLSNGPGDPIQAVNGIQVVKDLAGSMPIFGVCLGHQIISLAMGARTYKLKFGHRGANQPVKDLDRGIVYITSQNHGFAVDRETIDGKEGKVTQINANDGTTEGLTHNYLDIICVQYHPEAHPGPWDTEKIFFKKVLEIAEKAKKIRLAV
jgi:carbamoyl-phosphate synthase small subunit